jgi:hypothetical protein
MSVIQAQKINQDAEEQDAGETAEKVPPENSSIDVFPLMRPNASVLPASTGVSKTATYASIAGMPVTEIQERLARLREEAIEAYLNDTDEPDVVAPIFSHAPFSNVGASFRGRPQFHASDDLNVISVAVPADIRQQMPEMSETFAGRSLWQILLPWTQPSSPSIQRLRRRRKTLKRRASKRYR